jgi:hypothetical protein
LEGIYRVHFDAPNQLPNWTEEKLKVSRHSVPWSRFELKTMVKKIFRYIKSFHNDRIRHYLTIKPAEICSKKMLIKCQTANSLDFSRGEVFQGSQKQAAPRMECPVERLPTVWGDLYGWECSSRVAGILCTFVVTYRSTLTCQIENKEM